MAKNGGLFHGASGPGQAGMESRKSMSQNTSVGSGSRPTKSKIAIRDAAPSDPKTMGRGTRGALK